jgi:hypothetical protein
MNDIHDFFPDATSLPYTNQAISDLGPGTLSGGSVSVSESMLANVVQGGTIPEALAAENIRTATKVNANFVPYPFTITPPFTTHPATPMAYAVQILGTNSTRKSLVYQETQNAGRAANGVTQSGIVLQPGPNKTTSVGQSVVAQMIQTSYLSNGGSIEADSPCPTNPVTVVVQYGPPATVGSPITPLVGVIYEGS